MFAALLTTLLFSISVVCGHRSAQLVGGTEANFWRLTLATIFLGIWSYGFGIGLEGSAFPLFLLSGILGIGFGDVALFQALPRLGSRLSMLLIQCLTPPFGALLEWLWLRTPLTKVQMACGATVIAGVAVALTPGQHLKLTRGRLAGGTVYSLLAAFGGACGAVLSRKAYAVAHEHGQPIDGANAAFQRIVGGLLVGAVFLLIVKREIFLPQRNDRPKVDKAAVKAKWRRVWPWVLANSIAGQVLGVSFMQKAFETTPTGVALPIIAMTPIVVIPFAWFFEGERPTKRSLVGALIAVAGVVGLTVNR